MNSVSPQVEMLADTPGRAEIGLFGSLGHSGHESGEGSARSASASLMANTVPDLIAQAFAESPLQPAVEFEGQSISRAELAERSDRLAAWLVGHAAGSGCLVGIFMERSVEMLVGILGVMKAGAAYVPLDPAFPRARNETILGETRVPVLLTLEKHLERLPECDARTLCLDGTSPEWASHALAEDGLTDWELPEVMPEMRAYVIFTSGSTGKPKGVEVTHGSVVNLLRSAGEVLDTGERERLVAVTTLAFDISVLELLLPLVCGGTVVIANKDEASDAVRLKELLKSSRATMFQATPATFRSLLELGFEAPAGFKMMCGGEAWAPAMAERLLATGGRLWNMYGPTETTVWSSIVEVSLGATRVTFGPPIAKTRFYVMDADGRPVSDESGRSSGELWIAGVGVARGYFHRPDLTAERFVADPFVVGERAYRTGDEVRQHQDGTIEFIGRLDDQVKLRGFRIELGEIEAAMLAVPGVQEAVAMLRRPKLSEEQDNGFLAAVYAGEAELIDEDLRRVLRRRLPAYMLPKMFVRLESLPLTPNGKTDRRALNEMELPLRNASGLAESAVTEVGGRAGNGPSAEGLIAEALIAEGLIEKIEERMLGIWKTLFPGAAIVDSSDFFDLGGDSLLMVRLQSRIQTAFDRRLTMADVTRHSTYAGLVDWVRTPPLPSGSSTQAEEQHPALLPLQTEGVGAPVFIIPQMLIFRTLAEELGPKQPFFALQILDEDVPDNLASVSFEQLAQLYYKHIREVQPEGPYRLGGWCLWGWMAYEVARQLEADGAQVEMLAIIDAWAPGYWQRYSPLRQSFVNAGHFWQRLTWYAESMKNLPLRERVADGMRRFSELSTAMLRALPRGLRPELEIVETLRIQKFASRAAESYRPGPIKGNVVIFKSELRPTGSFVGEDMGWSAVLEREVRLDALPGNHNDIFKLPAARIMAARIREVFGRFSTNPDDISGPTRR